jgi:methyltransferase FkbM-like protein
MKLNRQEFLAALGAVATVPLDALAQAPAKPAPPKPAPPGAKTPAQSAAARKAAEQAAIDATGVLSFAQSGEDLIAHFIFHYLQIPKITYMDVGAHDPVAINNTYFFYRRGFRGVLVEPNVEMCKKLRAVRPQDTTLEAGIGVTAAREADYYVMTESAWNTFSKEEAEHMAKVTGGGIKVERVIKMPLLEINDVMWKHFGGAPTFLSIDAEGLHLAILKTIDFKRFRPAVICVETLVSGTKQHIPEIPAFMETQKYVVRGSSFVNTILVDGHLIG